MSHIGIPLKEILINARQESVQMQHYYVGIEHLFIAMLQIQDGLMCSILEEQGLRAEYVIDAIRRKSERGAEQLSWPGLPYTPRTETVLNMARNLTIDDDSTEISERELLNAIFQEGDSLPIRVLKSLRLDIDDLATIAQTYTLRKTPQLRNIHVTFGEMFDPADTIEREQLFVLRRMFFDHVHIRIERRLRGFGEALILIVTPIRVDGREDAPVVTKIDLVDNVLDEFQRYEAHVKDALPLRTARLEGPPTVPEACPLGGLKYTLVSANSGTSTQDLRTYLQNEGSDTLNDFLKTELFEKFGPTWWQQKRQFRFQVWREYDWMLPPVLTLHYVAEKDLPLNVQVLNPYNRAKAKAKLRELQFNNVVILENFTVQKTDPQRGIVKLAIGFGSDADKRAFKVEMRGVDLAKTPLFRGQQVERIAGRIWKTRHETLMEAARSLAPDFDISATTIPIGQTHIPNPLYEYDDLLENHVNGSVSKIHGDFHLSNILVGPDHSTWLIDFAHTRDGHTLFDWATLEVSLLGEAAMPVADDSWNTAREIASQISTLNKLPPVLKKKTELQAALDSVRAIRSVVENCLTTPENWAEYYMALAFCALRGSMWEKTMTPGARRMLFLVSGVAIMELRRKPANSLAQETPAPDETGVLTDYVPMPVSFDRELEPLNDSYLEEKLPDLPEQQKRPRVTRKLPSFDQFDHDEDDASTRLQKTIRDDDAPPS